MLNKDRIALQTILESVDKIERNVNKFRNADELFRDSTHFDAAMMNFIIIGEMVARISNECKEQNRHIEWDKIKGFRNIVAHDYFGIDAEEVWQIATTRMGKLKADIEQILGERG